MNRDCHLSSNWVQRFIVRLKRYKNYSFHICSTVNIFTMTEIEIHLSDGERDTIIQDVDLANKSVELIHEFNLDKLVSDIDNLDNIPIEMDNTPIQQSETTSNVLETAMRQITEEESIPVIIGGADPMFGEGQEQDMSKPPPSIGTGMKRINNYYSHTPSHFRF